MIRNMSGLLAGLLLCVLFAQSTQAFTLDPTVTVLRLPVDITGQTLVLRNPRNVDLPVVFEIFEREIKEDGSEVTTPADDNFVIFPPQVVVPAGKTQALRIQWVGGALAESRSFTLYAKELPLNLSGNPQSGVQTILRIGASVHVTSEGFISKPELTSYRPVRDGVIVSIKNSGNEFIYIDMLRMRFGKLELSELELANAAGRTLITPGATRTFKVGGVQGAPKLLSEN